MYDISNRGQLHFIGLHKTCFKSFSPHKYLDKDKGETHTQAKQAAQYLVLMGFRLCSDYTQIK